MPKKSLKKPVRRAVARKNSAVKKPVKRPVKIVATPIPVARDVAAHRPRFTMYVYWIIILSFICATFYILGRGHDILVKNKSYDVVLTEQGTEFLTTGKDKLAAGDTQGAIADFSAAVDSDPNAPMVYIHRAEAYLAEANYIAAESDLNRAIELDPENSLAHYDRALLDIQVENFDAAMADLDAALKSFGQRPNKIIAIRDIYSKRAQLNLWMKNWDAAIVDYSMALNESGEAPSDEDYAGRADAYTALGSYDAAVGDYMLAVTTISNTIKDIPEPASRINMSRRAMSYFEKSAALHVQIGDMVSARSDLEAASTLATALNDESTRVRLQELMMELPAPQSTLGATVQPGTPMAQ
jgi:predicted Zn-dependent protease